MVADAAGHYCTVIDGFVGELHELFIITRFLAAAIYEEP